MNKFTFCLFCVLIAFPMSAQVGINTETPLQLFHIDPKSDTNATRSNNFSDDVVIDKNGQMGLGTIKPNGKIDIVGNFRYRNNPQNNKILVSDNLGNASWGDRPRPKIIEVDNIKSALSAKSISTTKAYTGISITIPSEQWQIIFQVTCTSSSGYNIYWDLCPSPTSYSLTDVPNRKAVSSSASPVSVTASYFVKNTVETTYYLWASTISGTATYLAGGTMWAMMTD